MNTETSPAQGNEEMTTEEILSFAQASYDSANTYMQAARSEGDELLNRYKRKPYGDELPNRSQYVSGDVAGTVDWALTDLIRLFLSGDQIAEFTAEVPGDEAAQFAKQETDYTNAIFLRDNDGYQNLRNYLFNGLLGKRGYLSVYWEDPKLGDTVQMTGVSPENAERYLQKNNIQIDTETAVQNEDGTFDFEYAEVRYDGCIKIQSHNMNEVLVAKGFETEDDADYVALRIPVSRSDLVKMFPDKRTEIEEIGQDEDEEETVTDYDNEPEEITGVNRLYARANDRFHLLDEFIRLDRDRDGIAELVNVKRVGNVILSVEDVDMQPLSSWSSHPEPDVYFASSLGEKAEISQRQRTVTMRQANDSVKLATMPKYLANADTVNINALLDPSAGGIVPVTGMGKDGDVGRAAKPLLMNDVSKAALSMLDVEEKEREFNTGINRQSQGLDPDSLTDTYSGMKLLQNAASARKEYIAREAARGLERVFTKISALIRRHHNFEREMKTKTGFVTFSPMSWLDRTAVDIDIGAGTGSRDAQLGQLQVLGQLQREMVEAGLPTVDPQRIYNLASEFVEAVGFKSPEKYFVDPSTIPPAEPQEEAPDPALLKAQADIQIKQQRFQLEAEKQQFDMVLKERDMMMKNKLEEMQKRFEAHMATQKQNNETQLALIKANSQQIPEFRPGGRLDQ